MMPLHMQAAPVWLHIYYVARVCKREHFSKELVIMLLSWLALPVGMPVDTSKHPSFFGFWSGSRSCMWDDMIVIRECRPQSEPYLRLKCVLQGGYHLPKSCGGHGVSAECPW
jgi:hypothetical protein